LSLHRQDRHCIDAEGKLEPQAWADGPDELPKPLHDPHALGADGVDASGEAGHDKRDDGQGSDATDVEARRVATTIDGEG
jgi:hypothetical protein